MDKTGTVTYGRPQLTDVVSLNGLAEADLLRAVASVEARSEHPLARAIVQAATERGLASLEPEAFTPLPGRGLVGTVAGREWAVGNRRLLAERGVSLGPEHEAWARELESAGKTAFFVANDGGPVGLVAVADTIRPDVRDALTELKRLGVRRLLLLTGDNERVAAAIAGELGVEYRADLLPEAKIAALKALQAEGGVVMMVGDGVNDAPALVQADVGVAMGVAGTDVALEAADVALMRDDWAMVPEALRLGRRAAGTIRQNLGFTALYNAVGITLAFLGLLPPVWAAAAQSLPDVAIMLNSSRLLRSGGASKTEVA
jgi:Cd2+/Zn2+-exporting ATPase/Cu+-exporting ATPase